MLRGWSRKRLLGFGVVSTAAASSYLWARDAGSRDKDESGFRHTGLHPVEFSDWTVIAKRDGSSTSKILTLRPPPSRSGGDDDGQRPLGWQDFRQGTWSVMMKQPQLQVERAYTPIPLVNTQAIKGQASSTGSSQDLIFLVRQDGEVSRYINAQQAGATVELRGPRQELSWSAGHEEAGGMPAVDEILFIAGGTGIAPALQMAAALAPEKALASTEAHNGDSTFANNGQVDTWQGRMTVLWANRRREDCLGGINDAILPDTTQKASSWKSWASSLLFSDHHTTNATGPAPTKRVHDIVYTLEHLRAALGRNHSAVAAGRATEQDNTGADLVPLSDSNVAPLRRAQTSMLNIAYFVDEEGTSIQPSLLRRLLQQPLSQQLLDKSEAPRRAIVVSGPPGFVAAFAGPKEWQYGEEVQGPLGGVLGQLKTEGLLAGWVVWKL